jgi:hypothetical protein
MAVTRDIFVCRDVTPYSLVYFYKIWTNLMSEKNFTSFVLQ